MPRCARVPPDEDAALEQLSERLRAVANPVRLHILRSLVVPTRAADVRVRAAAERAGLGAGRVLGRSTVVEHLAILEGAGLVRRLGELYALNQQGMVALLQDLGGLASLRALVEVDVEVTRVAATPPPTPSVPLPRLLLANGPGAGRAIPLDGAGPWSIGRDAACEVALSHDPHVSRVHATLSFDRNGYTLGVAQRAKNPALVDFAPVAAGERALVRAGSVVAVGATLLVLQT